MVSILVFSWQAAPARQSVQAPLDESAIFHSPYPHGIRFLKFWGQGNVGKILKANRPCEPKDSPASHRCAPPVGCRRIGPAVDHGFTDLDTCRRTVEDQPTYLGFEKRGEIGKVA